MQEEIDQSILEENKTFLLVEENNDETRTGLVKNSLKGVDLGGTLQQIDFGTNNETSVMDNSMTD